jgi:hypothetical protein
MEVPITGLRLALFKGLKRAGVSFPSPEDENRSSSETVCFLKTEN